jgi:hypothetical protein
VDCSNPSNVYASVQCVGPLTCDQGMCGRDCSATTDTTKLPSCSSDTDCQEGVEYCSSGTCCTHGKCGEVVDSSNPSHVYASIKCVGPLTCDQGMNGRDCGATTDTVKTPSCSSDTDCQGGGKYCSGGTCRAHGKCGNVADCVNPSNEFASVMCVGYTTCDQGMCGTVCSDSFCADGSDLWQ